MPTTMTRTKALAQARDRVRITKVPGERLYDLYLYDDLWESWEYVDTTDYQRATSTRRRLIVEEALAFLYPGTYLVDLWDIVALLYYRYRSDRQLLNACISMSGV